MKKRSKVLAAAIAMMTLSTAASITGTVAWFTANNVVSASGMSIKAEAEQGIVISNEDKTTWAETATAKHTGGDNGFIPTSTANAVNWYHANAADADNYAHNTDGYNEYTTSQGITESTGSSGTGLGSIDLGNIYLINHFYIKSSTVNAFTETGKVQKIYLKSVTATLPETVASANLDKALRVLVKSDAGLFVVAPISGATLSYTVNNASAVTALDAIAANDTSKYLWSGTEIPAYDSNSPIDISVYCYFEGEDQNCKSTNIKASMDLISVETSFGRVSVAA